MLIIDETGNLVTCTENQIQIWDYKSKKVIKTFEKSE